MQLPGSEQCRYIVIENIVLCDVSVVAKISYQDYSSVTRTPDQWLVLSGLQLSNQDSRSVASPISVLRYIQS